MDALRVEREHSDADAGAAEELALVVEEHLIEIDIEVVEGHLHRSGIAILQRAREE